MKFIDTLHKWWEELHQNNKALMAVLSVVIIPISILGACFAMYEHINKKKGV